MIRAFRSLYLRWLLRCTERDVAMHEWHAAREPALAALARARAAELRAELAVLGSLSHDPHRLNRRTTDA